MSTITQNVTKSRWGFHPCTYETFRKLKELNKVFEIALRQQAAWKRWERKAPHNRVMRKKIRNSAGQVVGYHEPQPLPEPKLCALLEKVTYKTFRDRSGKYLNKQIERERVVLTDVAGKIATDYTSARYPAPTPEEVTSMYLSEELINQLYEELVS